MLKRVRPTFLVLLLVSSATGGCSFFPMNVGDTLFGPSRYEDLKRQYRECLEQYHGDRQAVKEHCGPIRKEMRKIYWF